MNLPIQSANLLEGLRSPFGMHANQGILPTAVKARRLSGICCQVCGSAPPGQIPPLCNCRPCTITIGRRFSALAS